ncbi:MAG: HIT domain-containing protein [Acidobacteriia bacterium]|nr:HIT domain-containing protein [Terriglobia bacterium]
MDYLFTPWRFAYMASVRKTPGCLFCEKLRETDDRQAFIIHRGEHCFIILNIYPYTSGHVMIVPYEHVDELRKVSPAAAAEMMALSQRVESALRAAYKPDGINLGMNIGAAAGAGVAGHIHMHVLPRWIADSNFMSTVAETRVVPEDLATTWEKLRRQLELHA